jgi:hypothetical protein
VKAYEFAGEIMADGQLKLPEAALVQLAGHYARVIVLVPEEFEKEESTEWRAMAADQFLAGYSEADAIYDAL